MSNRKLPPLSPKSGEEDTGDDVQERPRRKKKRLTAEQDGSGPSPRRKPRRSDAESDGATSPNGRVRRTRSRSGSVRRKPAGENGEAGGGRSGETSADAATSPTTRKVKKKKVKKGTMGTSRETLMADAEDTADQSGAAPDRKKRRKRKKTTAEPQDYGDVGLAADLATIQDDVVGEEEGEDTETEGPTNQTVAQMRSAPSNRIYIEQKGGFKSTDKRKLAKTLAERQRQQLTAPTKRTAQNTMEFALATNKVFRILTLFCHGLLAGFALWQIIMVYSLSDHSGGYTDFLTYYAPVALPVQSLYYVLLVLCTVSVLDRFDLGRPTRAFVLRACTLQNGAVGVVFYFLSLIVSLSVVNIDDKINLSQDEVRAAGLWSNDQDRDDELDRWRILNLVRGVCAILAWFILSITPKTDRLSRNLELTDDILGEKQQEQLQFDAVRSSGV